MALPLTHLTCTSCSYVICIPTTFGATFTSLVSLHLLIVERPPYHTAIQNVKTDSIKQRYNEVRVLQPILNDFIFLKKKCLYWAFLLTTSILLSKDNFLFLIICIHQHFQQLYFEEQPSDAHNCFSHLVFKTVKGFLKIRAVY